MAKVLGAVLTKDAAFGKVQNSSSKLFLQHAQAYLAISIQQYPEALLQQSFCLIALLKCSSTEQGMYLKRDWHEQQGYV